MQNQPKITPQSTLLIIKSLSKLHPDSNITFLPYIPNKPPIKYKFNAKNQVTLPYNDYILYRNGTQIAQIDLKPLSAYPQYQHHLHTKTYNQISPFDQSPQNQIIVNFLQFTFTPQHGYNIKLIFIDADITHDTQLIGNMHTYIKVKVKDLQKWRSKTIKTGDKYPNFNKQSVNINLNSINQIVHIQLWDEDMKKDDFIGGAIIPVYQMLGNNQSIIQYPIAYMKKQKSIPAGKIRFQVEKPRSI